MHSGAGMHFVPILDEPQRREMLELLAEGFPDASIDWPRAFRAPPGRSGHGTLLIVDGRAEGGILTFEKTEPIGGRARRIVNLSSWYIRPRYRKFAARMIRAVTSEPDTIYTGTSGILSVQKIGLRVGFRYASKGSIASLPLLNGTGLWGGIAVGPFVPAVLPDPDHDRWMADHCDGHHIGILVRVGSRVVPVLWEPGQRIRGFSAARLVFTTDHGVLHAALPAVHWHMLRYHGIAGLYLPRFAPYTDLRSVRSPHRGPSIVVKGDVDGNAVNLLYSETLYLH
jgi:hypothetical protein